MRIVFKMVSLIICLLPSIVMAQVSSVETACKVADKVIQDVRFYYNLKLAGEKDYWVVQTVDFSRNFFQKGTAYALSTVIADSDKTVKLSLVNYGPCKIMLNGKEVWNNPGMSKDDFVYIERDFILKGEVDLRLNKGVNKILIKSLTPPSGDWKVHLRPHGFNFTLTGLKEVEKSVSNVSKWLIIGTFPDSDYNKTAVVEQEFVTGKMYDGYAGELVSWNIPRLDIVAANAEIHQPWGEGYTAFNYHAAGLAMAMEMLGNYTGLKPYSDYSRTYCDFFIEKRKYMAYQKYVVNAFNAWDHKLVEGHLLDYTSAPLLPYAEVLLNTEPEKRKTEYVDLFNEMQEYLDRVQTRTPEGNFNRINPVKHTVWVDDMYMGLPFLVQSARLSDNADEKMQRLNEAAEMVFAFNKYVYHPEIRLYQHAQFTENPAKLPFWSRGNGWALWAVTNILSELPKNHPLYKRLLKHYRNHVEGLIAWQDKSGLWHNVLDVPESYLETSGTAIFTLCIARGIMNGWLNSKKYTSIVEKGWAGIETMIDDQYQVHGITVGTNGTTDINYYLERPTALNDCHGLFPVIIAAIEVDKLRKMNK